MDIKGLSIDDIIDMDWRDINKLSNAELKQLSSRLNSASNKRLRRLESSGLSEWSPAYQHVQRSGGDFSVKGKETRVQIKNEIERASDFLRAQTGTAAGTREHMRVMDALYEGKDKTKPKARKKKTPDKPLTPSQEARQAKTVPSSRKLKDIIDEFPSDMQKKKLFRALDKLREKNAAAVHNIGSPEIIKQLREVQKGDARTSRDRLVTALEEKYPELMKTSEEQYEQDQAEKESREDIYGVFHSLSSREEQDSPFKE